MLVRLVIFRVTRQASAQKRQLHIPLNDCPKKTKELKMQVHGKFAFEAALLTPEVVVMGRKEELCI